MLSERAVELRPVTRWADVDSLIWDLILKRLAWKDISSTRASCASWRREVDRCLERLHLVDPTEVGLNRLGQTFQCLARLKVTMVENGLMSELPGALGRVGHLRLRSKRPGGLLSLGHLRLLRPASAGLASLRLRACEVQSWKGLEACAQLAELHLLQCQYSPEAAQGLTRALAALPRLAVLELRCVAMAGPRRPAAGGQQQHATPQLVGLGASAPNLSALRIAASLEGPDLRHLLRAELPQIHQLRELDLELHPVRDKPLDGTALALGAAGGAAAAGAASSACRELAAVLPVVCVAAPHLTHLRVKGHTCVTDRDLHLLFPLRHLRQLSLDLSPAANVHADDPPQLAPPAAAGLQGAPAEPSISAVSRDVTSCGVLALLRGAPHLHVLSMAHVSWSQDGLRALGGMTTLARLRLPGAALPKGNTLCTFLHGLRSLSHLMELDLSGCAGAVSDWGLALLGRSASRLARLSVSGCGEFVSDVGVRALAPLMQRMQRLDLAFTERLTDQGLADLLRHGAPALRSLSIAGCPLVTDRGIAAIVAACPILSELDVDQCVRLNAASASALLALHELRRVSAEGCSAALLAALQGLARPRRSCNAGPCRSAALPASGESPTERLDRRLRESAQVETRVQTVDTEEEFLAALEGAGENKLLVVEVQSERVCETGLDEPEPELHWKLDVEKQHALQMAKCTAVKHEMQRTARECPDVTFIAIEEDGSSSKDALIRRLGVEVLPTLQFYRNGKLMWEHKGVVQMEAGIGEGVMYYGDAVPGGIQPSSVVADVTSRATLAQFLGSASDSKVLQVLNVALESAGPCIKVFPAVVALSRSFQGFATFGRLVGDVNGETRELIKELNIMEVPTFIFFRSGKEVGRHVGSSRGDLIGQILQQQESVGLSPPPPPVTAKAKPRSRAGAKRK
ncbi:Thioredoxin-like protein CDSP32, chloroplastic [Tetrabaena socialis]|uniref:Thioredoxin-like protein CDSP32, chloroplastic n=1 Tax=Tetrabaena socialis TaxID=47790 RepID=A0A2J7ZV99_9CHLO|nr:Thioredoxin-like protein CDSP32, chloroplastic [Tetrabaena socialis]|eukprot:PNH04195.1 Thioredoxin-like protein CDSP32, chloroplastic [Tetrabaena socialis]